MGKTLDHNRGSDMAQPRSETIIDAQRQDRNRVAGGWEKWDRFFDEQVTCLNHGLAAARKPA